MNKSELLDIVTEAEDHLSLLREVNPNADFAQATDDLRQARTVAETWNGRREDLKLFFEILNRGKNAAQVASTNDVKRRFQEAGKVVFLCKEVRRAVINRADDIVGSRGHHEARGFLIRAIKIAQRPNAIKGDVERELLVLVGGVEEPRTPAKILMHAGATFHVAAVREKAKQAEKPPKSKKEISGQFVGDPAKVRVSVCEGRNILTPQELKQQEAEAEARRRAKDEKNKKPAKKEKSRRRAA